MSYDQLSFIKDDEYKKTKKFKPLLPEGERPKKVVALKPPKGVIIPKGYSWCPYCSMTIQLAKDKKLGIKRCPVCGISSKDYYMKSANYK